MVTGNDPCGTNDPYVTRESRLARSRRMLVLVGHDSGARSRSATSCDRPPILCAAEQVKTIADDPVAHFLVFRPIGTFKDDFADLIAPCG